MADGATGVATNVVADLLPNKEKVSSALENAILPGTGIVLGYLAADFIGVDDAIAGFLLERLAAEGELNDDQRMQLVWATNGATIAIYSIVLLVGLGFWASDSKWLGPIITGVGAGLVLNKVVDTVTGVTK